jgi:uncharacterized protein (TIGR03083 family)
VSEIVTDYLKEQPVKSLAPVLTGELFLELRRDLVSLLKGLSEPEWRLPTAAPSWNVKDVALHILGGDVANLSRRRDGFSLPADLSSYEKLVRFINEINGLWVAAGQRMSAPVIIDLMEHLGQQMDEYFASLDPFAPGGTVGWAGPAPMPQWFDVAREYTERWHHQQQIRDATGRPGLYAPRLFAPVLDTFVRALPRTFREVEAKVGTVVRLVLTGTAGREWSLVQEAGKWELFEGRTERVDAEVTIAAEKAWKIFTRGLRGNEALRCTEIRGDRVLGAKVLETVSVIA